METLNGEMNRGIEREKNGRRLETPSVCEVRKPPLYYVVKLILKHY